MIIGTLVVVVLKGKNLPDRRKMGKQDPYCICRVGRDAKRTNIDRRGGQAPEWDDEIRFDLQDLVEHRSMKLSCFSDEPRDPDLIGDCFIPLDRVLRKHEEDAWFEMRHRDKYAGEIYIEMTFYSLALPPIPSQQESVRRKESNQVARPLPIQPGTSTTTPNTLPYPEDGVIPWYPESPTAQPGLDDLHSQQHMRHGSLPKTPLHIQAAWNASSPSVHSASSFDSRPSSAMSVSPFGTPRQHGSCSGPSSPRMTEITPPPSRMHANSISIDVAPKKPRSRLSLPYETTGVPFSPESFSIAPYPTRSRYTTTEPKVNANGDDFLPPSSYAPAPESHARPLPLPPGYPLVPDKIPKDTRSHEQKNSVHRGSRRGLGSQWVKELREII